jgi:NADPH-dependent 2,4-dienoyl-CoA reductase/sulfur reductase-like enzyme
VIDFEGRPVTCRTGDSVAAALVDADELDLRETAQGGARGLFCGMGVCQECLVTIDGVAGQRACLTPVREGMRVRRQPARPALDDEGVLGRVPAGLDARAHEGERAERELAPDARPDAAPAAERTLAPDVLVVGSGPAGLAAAAVAAEAGLDVALVDERGKLGGQYFKQPAVGGAELEERALDRQFRAGRALIARVRAAGVTLLPGVEVWGAFGPCELAATGAGARWLLRPRALVLACGAYERGVPFPGWTLPGVMTTGAAQTLLRAHGVAPGARVLVSGHGPLNLQLAAELARSGARVVALAELARLTAPGRTLPLARMAALAPDLARDGLRYRAALLAARVPVLEGSVVVCCEGAERVERAALARVGADGRPVRGSERVFAVDAVCLGFGFAPSNELSRALGCRHRFDARRHELVVERDPFGRTSVPGVWVAGDAGGIGGARLAQAGGALAGADVVRALGGNLPAALRAEVRAAARARRRGLRFQVALRRLYAAPHLVDELAAPDTPICRCEGVPLRALEVALADDVGHIGTLKRATRAGMGGCQGRYCAPLLAEMAGRRSGRPLDERSGFAPSAPARPTPIAALAGGPREPKAARSPTPRGF